MKLILFLCIVLSLTSCNFSKTTSTVSTTTQTKSEPKTETVIMMVNSNRVPCVGVAPQECLEVKYLSGERKSEDWENFYSDIEGFEYVPGNIYTIEVELIHLDPSTIPAGASSIDYKLIEVKEVVPALK